MSRQARRPTAPARSTQNRRPWFDTLELRELMALFTVTTNADSGNGSLREVIAEVNADSEVGADSIAFSIPGSGVQTISLASALPAITRSVVVDGSTQPGYSSNSPSPEVVIDGTGAGLGADGLSLTAGSGSVIKALSIVGFAETSSGTGGAGILLGGTSSNATLQDDYLGILPDGQTPRANANGVVVNTGGNLIGIAGTDNINVISGNTQAGVLIVGASATGNLVSNDLIGTDKTGLFDVGNTDGVILAALDNTIGGTTAAVGNVISGNVGPTGQTGIGILFQGPSTGNVVQGNVIGADLTAGSADTTNTTALPNVYGIYFGTPGGSSSDVVQQDTIGGTVAGAGNIISGNFIGITGNVSTSLIAGNIFGLAGPSSTTAVPNGDAILLGATGSTIGGTTAQAQNVISASSTSTGAAGTGLDLTGNADVVQGNFIGANVDSQADLPSNASLQNVTGLSLHVTNSTIGGTTQGAGNVISGNSGDGLVLDIGTGNLVEGNAIGLSASLQAPLGNGGAGLVVGLSSPSTAPTQPLALNDTIGGTVAGAANIISNNAGSNIIVRGSYSTGYTGLTIRGNSISGNQLPGIDLAGTGVPTPSTLFLTSANDVGGSNVFSGIIQGQPSTTYLIDIYGNTSSAPVATSGFGPGQYYEGAVSVTTDASGFATFNPSLPVASGAAVASFSATSTGPDGTTSEFSANLPATDDSASADLAVTSTASSTSVVVGTALTLTETVTNNGPAAAPSVQLFDSLPTSLVNAQVTTSLGTSSISTGNVVSALIGSLASGQSATVTITGTPSQAGPLVDTSGASSTTLDPNYANNEASQTVTVTSANAISNADLAIAQVASATSGKVGQTLTYTVTVTNNGPASSTNATVNDFLPGNVTLVGAQSSQGASPTQNGTLITDNLGTIASGASATLTIIVTPTAAGTITNSANVSGNQIDPVTTNNSSSLSTVIAAPNVGLLLSASINPTTVTVGQIQLFTLTVTNTGTDPATNVTIINALPTNSIFVNAAPSQGAFPTPVDGVITDDLGTIAAGATATLTIVVVPTATGTLINYAGVYTPDLPSVPASFAYGAVAVTPQVLGPSVTGVASSGNLSQIAITFSEPLNPTTATNPANYVLIATGTKGKNRQIAIITANYNQVNNSVRIVPAAPLSSTQTYQLVVIGTPPSGIADAQGRRLVGTTGGASGTNYIVNFLAKSLPVV